MRMMDSSGFYVGVTVSTPAGLIYDVSLSPCACVWMSIGESLFTPVHSKIRHSEGVLSPSNYIKTSLCTFILQCMVP